MKKIPLLMLVIIGLASCKKNNPTPKPAAVTIVGKWNYKSERTQVLSATGTVVSDETETSFPADMYEQYNADGTGVAMAGGGSEVLFTYSISGSTLTAVEVSNGGSGASHIFTIALTATTLTEHSETTAHNQTTIVDDVMTK